MEEAATIQVITLPHASTILKAASRAGMTLVEVLVATAVFALVFGSVLTGITQASYRVAWSKYNAAATKFAEQRMEQIQSAPLELVASPPIDAVVTTNFPTDYVDMEHFVGSTNRVRATRTVTIDAIPNSNPNAMKYKVITVNVFWSYRGRGPFTNTLVTIRAPDQ
jgi:prepilin-type N-terminal cleavage/methylation domain-containing protein